MKFDNIKKKSKIFKFYLFKYKKTKEIFET